MSSVVPFVRCNTAINTVFSNKDLLFFILSFLSNTNELNDIYGSSILLPSLLTFSTLYCAWMCRPIDKYPLLTSAEKLCNHHDENQRLSMCKWIYSISSDSNLNSQFFIQLACKQNALLILHWIAPIMIASNTIGPNAVNYACRNGHLTCVIAMFHIALRSGGLHYQEELIEVDVMEYRTIIFLPYNCVEEAVLGGHIHILEWLEKHCWQVVTEILIYGDENIVQLAFDQRNKQMLDWFVSLPKLNDDTITYINVCRSQLA